mmetsp:Transcript_129189/g.257938  ORF Transcript_129189/g.257938 Transcript_129189/m.257938 type:complete len:141 (+) Transcript_129189:73-495(+)
MTCGRDEDIPRRRLSWKDESPMNDLLGQANSAGSGFGKVPSPVRGGIKASMNSSDRRWADIDDRRAMPSEADHHKIMKSFQQDMSNVETVILYDHHNGAHAELEAPNEAGLHGAVRFRAMAAVAAAACLAAGRSVCLPCQ